MELPESNVPADIFWDLIYAAGKPQVLKYGIDFKVFNHLSLPISAEEVARRIDTKPEPTSRLLDILVIIGAITKDGDRYVNTPLAEEYFVEGKPTYMGDFYAMSIEMYIEGMVAKIPQALKSGIQEMDVSQAYPDDYWGRITDTAARAQRAMWSYKASPLVTEMPEFPSFKRMLDLDLGGSAGIFTVALVSGTPR